MNKHHNPLSSGSADAARAAIEDPIRLAALRASGLLDTPPSEAFDQVTRLACSLLEAPTALLSLVDKDRQFFKSQHNFTGAFAAARQTPLSHSFCQWVVAGREQIAIDDARAHPVLKSNLAIKDMGVIAYTGVPVSGAEGQVLGSLCAIDGQPRAWRGEQVEVLRDLAELAEAGIAHASLLKTPPKHAGEFDRYVHAAGEAVNAATRLLRRAGVGPDERELLLVSIERHTAHLVQLNRLIQVTHALA